MACGTCAKKKLTLRSDPKAMSTEMIEELRSYLHARVLVKDRLGIVTYGTCVEVQVEQDKATADDQNASGTYGNVALETFSGLSLIGLDMIESIELSNAVANAESQSA